MCWGLLVANGKQSGICEIVFILIIADHHGPPKVNCWQDPMSPSKWKEEHVSLVLFFQLCCIQYELLTIQVMDGPLFTLFCEIGNTCMEIILTGCFVLVVCNCFFIWLGSTLLWRIQVLHQRQGQEGRGTLIFLFILLQGKLQYISL